jgi:uroporphyrinogen-III synthase
MAGWPQFRKSVMIRAMETPIRKGFAGLRVLSLESRRAPEMAKLIETYGGVPRVAPSMREVPLASNTMAQEFVRKLLASGFDAVIFLTGVGTRALTRVAETVCSREELIAALQKVTVVARGPKPVLALKEMGVPVTLAVPEPNTWKELLRTLDEHLTSLPLHGCRVAVQEYGASNRELLEALTHRGAQVTRVPVYEWDLPQDTTPLREAVSALARHEVDVALFTTSIQVIHLLKIADEMRLQDEVREAFGTIFVGSIGPVTSDELRSHGIAPDFEPSHPKMGFLVNEAAQRSAAALEAKKSG